MVPIFNNTQQIIPSFYWQPQLEYFICKGIFVSFICFSAALCASVVNYPVFVKMSIPTARPISLFSSIIRVLPCSVGIMVIALFVFTPLTR